MSTVENSTTLLNLFCYTKYCSTGCLVFEGYSSPANRLHGVVGVF